MSKKENKKNPSEKNVNISPETDKTEENLNTSPETDKTEENVNINPDTDKTENQTDKKSKSKSKKKPKKPINKRKLKYGSVAAAITVVFIAVIVLVNVFFQALTERYPLKLDLTTEKVFEVSQETIDFLTGLENEVDIVVMKDESSLELGSSYDKQLIEVVKKYAQNSSKVNVSFIDMDKNPNYVSKYNDIYKGEISEGNIVVTSNNKIRVLTASELYNTESYYYYTYITSSKAEQALTSAVMYVTDQNPKTIGILSVTSPSSVQASLNNFKSTLESNGYDITDIDLMSVKEIDSNIDLVIIPAPLNDFTSSMTEKLTDYLYNEGKLGKNVLYMANYDQNNTPNIDTFLAEWGIEVGDGYIYETDENLRQIVPVTGMQNYIASSVAQFADEETYGEMLSDTSLPIMLPVSRPLTLLFDSENDRETSVILKTSASSAVIPIDADNTYQIDKSQNAERNAMVKGTKYIFNENNEKVTSNVTVMGSSFIVDYSIVSETAYNNGEFIVNLLNSITGKSNGITIVAKSMSAPTITISDAQKRVLTIVFTFIIPAIIAVIGITVFVRRKNR